MNYSSVGFIRLRLRNFQCYFEGLHKTLKNLYHGKILKKVLKTKSFKLWSSLVYVYATFKSRVTCIIILIVLILYRNQQPVKHARIYFFHVTIQNRTKFYCPYFPDFWHTLFTPIPKNSISECVTFYPLQYFPRIKLSINYYVSSVNKPSLINCLHDKHDCDSKPKCERCFLRNVIYLGGRYYKINWQCRPGKICRLSDYTN